MKDDNKTIRLDLPPVGVKILSKTESDLSDVDTFHGISYCNALFRATFGEEILLRPDSVNVCQWAPVVLGFKNPENDFEKSITEHLSPVTPGIYMAPLHLFRKGIKPDVVIIRTDLDNYRYIIDSLGWDNFIDHENYSLDLTALDTFKNRPPVGVSAWMIKNTNRLLHYLNRFGWWQWFIAYAFKSTLLTKFFDKFITRFMANMSMCRNSTVIPFQKGKANVSYFCTGGIAWGKNKPDNMTSGYPYGIYQKLAPLLDYPGKDVENTRFNELEKEKKKLQKIKGKKSSC